MTTVVRILFQLTWNGGAYSELRGGARYDRSDCPSYPA